MPRSIEGLSLEAAAAGSGNFSVLLDLVRALIDGLASGVFSPLLSASTVSSGMYERGANMGCGQLSVLPACMAKAICGYNDRNPDTLQVRLSQNGIVWCCNEFKRICQLLHWSLDF
jgi:hypothetical protein